MFWELVKRHVLEIIFIADRAVEERRGNEEKSMVDIGNYVDDANSRN